jgi:uncharacterized repeat protein (TIGR01451 family)
MQTSTRTPKVGDLISYSVTVTNKGPLPATNIQLIDNLPLGVVYQSSSFTGVSNTGNSVTIDMGTLPVGDASRVAFSARVNSSGTFVNGVQVQHVDQPDPTSLPGSGIADGEDDAATVDLRTTDATGPIIVSANPNQRTLPPVVSNQPPVGAAEADLSLALQVDNQAPIVGSALSVTLLVNNRGTLGSGNTTISLTLPTGWQWGNPSGWSVNGQTGTASIDNIVAGTSGTLVVSVQAGNSGTRTLKAEVASAIAPDTDSPHGNGNFNRGEDDEAAITIRVR